MLMMLMMKVKWQPMGYNCALAVDTVDSYCHALEHNGDLETGGFDLNCAFTDSKIHLLRGRHALHSGYDRAITQVMLMSMARSPAAFLV